VTFPSGRGVAAQKRKECMIADDRPPQRRLDDLAWVFIGWLNEMEALQAAASSPSSGISTSHMPSAGIFSVVPSTSFKSVPQNAGGA
jgi:hypothetical protein